MEFFKTVAGKLVGGLVALGVIVCAITWWQMDPATRHDLLSGSGKVLAWFGIVLVVPWATFFFVGRIGRMESNAAGAALVGGYTLLEAVLLAWLFDWSISGAAAWTFAGFGLLLAAVYNLFACDWIAEKLE